MIGGRALRTEIFYAQRPTQNYLRCATPHLENCGAQCPRRAEALRTEYFWCATLRTLSLSLVYNHIDLTSAPFLQEAYDLYEIILDLYVRQNYRRRKIGMKLWIELAKVGYFKA